MTKSTPTNSTDTPDLLSFPFFALFVLYTDKTHDLYLLILVLFEEAHKNQAFSQDGEK